MVLSYSDDSRGRLSLAYKVTMTPEKVLRALRKVLEQRTSPWRYKQCFQGNLSPAVPMQRKAAQKPLLSFGPLHLYGGRPLYTGDNRPASNSPIAVKW